MTRATSYRLFIAIATALALLIGGLSTAFGEEPTGAVTGIIKNESAGGGSVAGMEVKLYTYAHQSEGGQLSATTDAGGAFRFDNLSTSNTSAYRVIVEYQDVTYGSELIVFDRGLTTESIEIPVFETANDPKTVSIDRAHVVVNPAAEGQPLQLMEILIVKNDSDRVFITNDPTEGTLRVRLPQGAQNLEFAPELEGSTVSFDGGFAYAQALAPGDNQFLYSYELPFSRDQYELVRSFDYPIRQLSFLIPDQGIKATSPTLAPQPAVSMGGQQSYNHLLGSDLAAGTAVSVNLSGLPVPSPFAIVNQLLQKWGIPGAIALLFAGIVAFVLLRRRRSSSMDEQSPDDEFDDEPPGDDDEISDEEVSDEEPIDEVTRR